MNSTARESRLCIGAASCPQASGELRKVRRFRDWADAPDQITLRRASLRPVINLKFQLIYISNHYKIAPVWVFQFCLDALSYKFNASSSHIAGQAAVHLPVHLVVYTDNTSP